MWKATAFNSNRVWSPTTVIQLEEGPFTSERVLQAAKGPTSSLPSTHQHLLRYLEQEATSPELSRDAIEIWGNTAQAESEYFDWAGAPKLKMLEEALALFSSFEHKSNTLGKPSTLAWHDHTGVVLPLTGEEERVRLEYVPSTSDEHRLERLRFRYGDSDYVLETIFDWRGYFGRESGLIDGWRTMRQSGKGFVASLKGTFGIVVGSVLRRLTRPEPTLERDPTARGRLIRMSERYRHIASAYPDLSTIPSATHERAVVFVHGTVSCGIQSLKDLYPFPALAPGPIYRYEHDTFVKLDANGDELARLIRDRIDARHLLIAAHSRGGLVAKIAAHQLKRERYSGDISVYTFGTPYLGTPLVAQGKKALNLLYKLGEDIAGAIPGMTPLTKGFFYVVDAPILPPGISVMSEESDGLPMLGMLGDPATTRAWGSDFDINRAPSGFGVTVEGALLGALEGRSHDLVVPTASALGFGAPQAVLSCSHVNYFGDPMVRAAFASFLVPPAPQAQVAPPPAPVANPAPARAPTPVTDPLGGAGVSPSTLKIEDHPDHVDIGGVRLDKRKATAQGAAKRESADPYARLKERRDKAGPGKFKLK